VKNGVQPLEVALAFLFLKDLFSRPWGLSLRLNCRKGLDILKPLGSGNGFSDVLYKNLTCQLVKNPFNNCLSLLRNFIDNPLNIFRKVR